MAQDSIGGNAKTVIVANVSPSEACLQETLSTLGFAARARKIVNKVGAGCTGSVLQTQGHIMHAMHWSPQTTQQPHVQGLTREVRLPPHAYAFAAAPALALPHPNPSNCRLS